MLPGTRIKSDGAEAEGRRAEREAAAKGPLNVAWREPGLFLERWAIPGLFQGEWALKASQEWGQALGLRSGLSLAVPGAEPGWGWLRHKCAFLIDSFPRIP